MKRRRIRAAIGFLWIALVPGCTSQQWAATGQAYGRNECLKIVDADERERCLRETGTSSEVYRRERAADAPSR